MNSSNHQKDEVYQGIFDNASEGIFQSSIEGRFLKVNPAMARIYGYESPEDMLESVTDISKQIHVDEASRKQFLEELIKHGCIDEFESRNYRKDGSIIWTRTNARTVRNEKGNILFFEGFLTDITASKETEIALRESEKRYRALVDHLPGIVFLDAHDDSEKTFYVSPKIEDILGYSPEEWINEVYWSDVIHPEDHDRLLAENKLTDKTGELFLQEYRVQKKDGEYIWIREESSLVKDEHGDPLFWQGFFLDISDRKKAEKAIRQSEEQFKTIFQANPLASCIATLKEGRFIAANHAYWKLSGFESDELLGRTSVELGFITEARRKKVVSRLKKEKSLRDEGGKLFTKSGESRNTLEFFDLISFDGQDCILSMFYDITDQVKAQAALQENEEKFRQLFEAESDAIFLIDNESGNILEVNAAASVLYGYGKEELLHKKNSDLSAEPEETNKVTRKTPINREQVIEIPLRFHKKKDGTIFPVEITGRFFEWRGRSVHIAAIRDITERKKAEEDLHSIAEFRQATIERLTEGLCVCHNIPDFPYIRFTVWNDRMTEITGYTIGQINKNGWYQSVYPDPVVQMAAIERMEQMRTGNDMNSEEWEITRADGKKRVLSISTTILSFSEDESHVLALMQDVTEQKRSKEALERQLNELTVLHNVALAASSSKSVGELIQRVTDTIGDTLYPDNCGVELLTESGDTLVPHPSYRGATNDVTRWHMHISQGVTGKVASTGIPIRLGDVSQEPAYIEATAGVQSELCVPIMMQDRVIGVINIESKKTDAFSETDERLLNTIAGTMATAIEQLRLFETSQRRLQELTILNAVSQASTDANNVDELIEKVTQIIGETLYPDNFGVLLINEEGTELLPHPSYRGVTEGNFPARVPLNEGISGQVAATGKPLRIANARKHKKYIEVTSQVRSELCVPITHGDRILGVINTESLKVNVFTEDDEQLLTTIASTLATAIEKLRLLKAEKKRRQDAEILREATTALTTSLDLQTLLETILDNLAKIVPYDSASLAMREDDKLLIVAGRGFPKNYDVIGKQLKSGGIWASLGKKRGSVIISDVQSHPEFEQWEGSDYIRGWMGVSMVTNDNIIGYIFVDSHVQGAFTEREATLVETFANSAAIAIENARLFEAEQRQHHESETLRQTAEAITSLLDIKQVLNAVLNNLSQVISFDSAALFLIEGENVRITAGIGFPENKNVVDTIFPASNALLQEVWNTGKPLILEDAHVDPRFEKWAAADQVRGWMGVPLTVRGEMIGCITIDSYNPGAYNQHDASLAITFAHQAAAAIENARLFERGEQQIRQLTVLRDIDGAISSSFDLRVVLDLLLEHAVRVLEADAAVILLYDPDIHSLSPFSNIGFTNKRSPYWSEQIRIGEGSAGHVVLQRKLVHISDLHNLPEFTQSGYSIAENFKSYFGIPLIGKGLIKGVLEIFTKKESHPNQDWFNFLHTLAGQAAIAIDNIQLFKKLQRSSQELILAYDATLAGWGQALELRDKETHGHSDRVVEHTIELARRMGVEGEDLTHIMRGTLLHDIGKMGVPDYILHKPGTLTEEEWDIMRQHPQYAFDLMNRIPYLRPAVDIPYAHHERWDGSGYPRGLKGEEIPLAARIFAVVDIWDALLYDRVYRKAWPEDKVLEYLKDTAGVELDPAIVEEFLKLLEEEKQYKKQAG